MSRLIPRWLLLLAFAVMLAVPALGLVRKPAPNANNTEKRKLAQAPKLELAKLRSYPKRFDAFVRDNFGLRGWMIKWHSVVLARVFHRSSVPNVLIGRDGWLYFAGDAGDGIGEFQGLSPLAPAQLQERQRVLEERRDLLAKHGIPYLFVVAPNKHSVYPEHLPLRVGARKPGNHLDSFMTHMRAHSSLPVLDLRTALDRERALGDLYFRTDTHWNADGAFVGYRAIMAEAQKLRPNLEPLAHAHFDVSRAQGGGGDLAQMLAQAEHWSDVYVTYRPRTTLPPPLPHTLVVIGDSFVVGLKPFLELTFEKVQHIHAAEGFQLERILAEKPALVIDERVERYLFWW